MASKNDGNPYFILIYIIFLVYNITKNINDY